MKIIALDIETANLDMDAEGLKFDNPKGWKTAVVCTYNSKTQQNNIYVGKDDYSSVVRKCGGQLGMVFPFELLQYHLRSWRNEGYLLLTHNGEGFDFPIMSKTRKEGGVGSVKSLLAKWPQTQKLDMAAYLKKETGIRYRLNHLIHGLLGEDASKLMDAANAPIEWNEGNHEEVIRYCIDDCQKTYMVLLEALEGRYFKAIGKDEYVQVKTPHAYTNTDGNSHVITGGLPLWKREGYSTIHKED